MALPPLALPSLPKSRLLIIGAIGLIALLAVLIFTGIIPGLKGKGTGPAVTLNVWGVFDNADTMNQLFSGLGLPYAIAYRQLDPATYESELVNALASGKGPDVFMLHSSWLPKHFGKLAPAPATLLPLADFRALYPTVVEQDFAPDGVIYALPLHIDTLALLYNRDDFDGKIIPEPPKTWKEFETLIPKLRELDSTGKIKKAAAAIGGDRKSVV